MDANELVQRGVALGKLADKCRLLASCDESWTMDLALKTDDDELIAAQRQIWAAWSDYRRLVKRKIDNLGKGTQIPDGSATIIDGDFAGTGLMKTLNWARNKREGGK